MIKVQKTNLEGVLLITPDYFEDHRGEYVETYNEETYKTKVVNVDFVQDDYSISCRNVLRGIHGDSETWKLVSCPFGKYYLLVVNLDETSPQYQQWQSFVLSDKNHHQVLIPPKFGNGHLILSRQAIFNYKQSAYYNPKGQFSIRWDEPEFDFWWPIKDPILSRRDQFGHYV